METAITPIINLFNNQLVRFAINKEGKTLISANDVMKVLGYASPRDAWYKMEPKVNQYFGSVAKMETLTKTGIYEMSYLTEEQLICVFLKSDKEEAKPFFRWAVEILRKEIKSQVIKDEAYYHNLILRYADYSTIKFRSEAIFDNFLSSEDGARSRRTDLIRVLPRCVQVWEIKAHPITENDVSRTIAYKGYLSLIAKRFPGKPIDFRFTSPYGITGSGKRLIELLRCQDEYKEISTDGIIYRCKLTFEPLDALANRVRQSIVKATPNNHKWQISKHVDEEFKDILTTQSKPNNVIPFPVKRAIASA